MKMFIKLKSPFSSPFSEFGKVTCWRRIRYTANILILDKFYCQANQVIEARVISKKRIIIDALPEFARLFRKSKYISCKLCNFNSFIILVKNERAMWLSEGT